MPRSPAIRPDLSLEHARGRPGTLVCGIDEVGRGPWAGPVVAAAVILDLSSVPEGIDDSKRLSARRREALLDQLVASARLGIGVASVDEIDAINILQASFLAMRRAVAAIGVLPTHALVDGAHVPPGLPCPAEAVVGGDARVLSIAAASVVAKVTRDRMMVALAQQFPGYAWEKNMGYGTEAHRDGLSRHGVTQHHRKSFAPIRKML